MTPADLARLHAETFLSPRPWTAAEFAGVLGGPGAFLLTEGAAFLVGRAAGGDAELLTLVVPATARRQGLGRRLLAGFEAEAVRRAARDGYLEVAADNGPARALYGAAGWREVGRRRAYYARPGGAPVDALTLAKRFGDG